MPGEPTFILFGLLVLIAIGAWAFGQFFDRDAALPTRISTDYIRGLNLVLSRKTDEALELFIQMAKVDDDTLETHFALGHLFRRQGEFERAIRVHENLLKRENLNDMQHDQALLALAEDYLGAGLYDRAEQYLEEIRDSETHGQIALEKLVYLYEREGEWEQAIDVHRRLEMLSGEKTPHVSHYYCELAERALAEGSTVKAREYLKNTIRSPSGALRGTLIRARIARNEEHYREAAGLYQQILENDITFLSEILPDLFDCYEKDGRTAEFDALIEKMIADNPATVAAIAYAAVLHDLTRSETLTRCLESFIADNDVLNRLIDVEKIESGSADERAAAISRVAEGLRMLALSTARYRCSNCGYGTQRFIWHCPSCKLWETVRPVQRLELETTVSN